MVDEDEIRVRWLAMRPQLNERGRRLWVADEAMAIGWGGISAVHRATGVSKPTIRKGIAELQAGETLEPGRVRAPGGGRKRVEVTDGGVIQELERLVDPVTRGDPESPLRWVAKSLRVLARELSARGHGVGHVTVRRLLKQMGYSLQANAKTREGSRHPDRNEQFEHINARCNEFTLAGDPVISVDAKKKELVGDFKNVGRELEPVGEPQKVRVHDFKDPVLGKANPYGIYDIAANEGYVSVGITRDTAAFAVESIRRWHRQMGAERYPAARRLLITADCGGSNGYRTRLWKLELGRLATELNIPISVCHLPPGTSKWNKIEHRLFSFITKNWRGKPLTTHVVIINLIAATTTETGLTVQCELDDGDYLDKIKVTDAQLATVNIKPDPWHGEWNYTIHPNT